MKTSTSAAPSREEAALKQELRRLQRHALLTGVRAPSPQHERMAQLRAILKRMDTDRFSGRGPAARTPSS
jgi:hypothetical protein